MKKAFSRSGLFYRKAGKGPPLIFIHGWAMASVVWERQIDYFSKRGFEAIAIDLGGHGGSSADGPFSISAMVERLDSFIEGSGYEAPLLVGWSMGAMLVLSYVERYAAAISGICLVGGTPKFVSYEDYSHGLDIKEVKGMKIKLKRDFNRSVLEFREAISKGLDEGKKKIIMEAPLPDRDVAMAGLDELMEVDLRASLKGIKIPALLLHGEEDSVCPSGAAKYMQDRIEHAELLIIKKTGHVPFLSEEDVFNKKLEEFAERTLDR